MCCSLSLSEVKLYLNCSLSPSEDMTHYNLWFLSRFDLLLKLYLNLIFIFIFAVIFIFTVIFIFKVISIFTVIFIFIVILIYDAHFVIFFCDTLLLFVWSSFAVLFCDLLLRFDAHSMLMLWFSFDSLWCSFDDILMFLLCSCDVLVVDTLCGNLQLSLFYAFFYSLSPIAHSPPSISHRPSSITHYPSPIICYSIARSN